MPEQHALSLTDLPAETKKTITLGESKILLVRTKDTSMGEPTLFAVEAECPHAKAPLEKGAVCDGRLVCPWHTGTFELSTGQLVEPPPLRDLKRYAVRVEGEGVLVDITPLPAHRPETAGQGRHLAFAGAGAATAAALAYLRDVGFAGDVTVIEPVSEEPVDRTQLSKMSLTGKKSLDTLPLFSPPGQEGPNSLAPLRVKRVEAAVTELQQADRSVKLSTGDTVPYDALLLATGGLPRRLEVPGADLPHVFTIRHPDDLRRLDPLAKPGARAAIVGDSFIAFEAASALIQRGLHVSVLAKSRLPFEKKFGKAVAEAILRLHRSHGTNLHTEVEVTEISPAAVTLNSGAEIPADLVIVAIGIRPVTDYASHLPRGEKGGFAVGRNLRLAPNLWCAGDIASVDGTRIEHWRLAEQHGRAAAEAMFAYATGNAHGPAQPFRGVPFFWTFHFGKRFGYAGHADTWTDLHIEGDPNTLDFLAFYVQENRVRTVLGCGRDTAIAALMEPLREPLTLEHARSLAGAVSAG